MNVFIDISYIYKYIYKVLFICTVFYITKQGKTVKMATSENILDMSPSYFDITQRFSVKCNFNFLFFTHTPTPNQPTPKKLEAN